MKLQAKVKATGEVFNILEINIPMGRASVALNHEIGRDYRIEEVEIIGIENMSLPPETTWQKPHQIIDANPATVEWFCNIEEQRRYEIAKAMLPAMNHATIREDVEASINYADELINQLKQYSDEKIK